MSGMESTHTGQTFNSPVYLNGDLTTNPEITIARQPYLLERYDFSVISRTESFWFNLGNTLFGASLGLFINMIAKLIANKIDPKIQFHDWEIYAVVVAIIFMGISFLVNHFVPNEKRRVVNIIKKHFDNY